MLISSLTLFPYEDPEFLTCTRSFSLKYFFRHFLQVRSTFLTGDRRLPFLFIWESLYFSITVNFPVYRAPGWQFSSFSTEHFNPLPLFAWPWRVQGYCCPSFCSSKTFFLWLFSRFSIFSLVSCSLNTICLSPDLIFITSGPLSFLEWWFGARH